MPYVKQPCLSCAGKGWHKTSENVYSLCQSCKGKKFKEVYIPPKST